MTNVICVAAGQGSTKKTDHIVNRRHHYLNYGLLSLASVLKRAGLEPVVVHGHFAPAQEVVVRAMSLGMSDTTFPVLISLPSFYAVGWTRDFIRLAKAVRPDLRFVLGGRWVVDGRPDLLRELIPEADDIVSGLAERQIADIVLRGRTSLKKFYRSGQEEDRRVSSLDYRLLDRRALYQPSIEVSRGCGMGCGFCQERSEPLQPLKAPEQLVSELQATLLQDSLIEMTPYFEASMFVPTLEWTRRLTDALNAADFAVRFRTEGRVDNIRPELIPALAEAGLSVLDLGLESASVLQLTRMKKTKNPSSYLSKASRLLQACAEAGVKVKVNVLLSAGETDDTVEETITWLDSHREAIFGVSVGPVIVYGWPQAVSGYLDDLISLGASLHHSPCVGVSHLNLSPTMDHERAVGLARSISRRYMTADSYFVLKSFSYFPRDYTYDAFKRDVLSLTDELSFDATHLRGSGASSAPVLI